MSQITTRICRAFGERRAMKIDNSETDGISLWLFGNKIAEWRHDGLWITSAGWMTKTTKERLNGLTGVRIQQLRRKWYLNDIEWEGDWVNVDAWNELTWRAESNDIVDEFDTTCEWVAEKKYSKPVYAVFHTTDECELSAIETKLQSEGIPSRRMESDTVGIYRPNYFVVVRPNNFEQSLITIKQ